MLEILSFEEAIIREIAVRMCLFRSLVLSTVTLAVTLQYFKSPETKKPQHLRGS
jgi:hypothetical protein